MRPLITAQSIGWCYMLHLSRPLGNLSNTRAQAQHYQGWADDPAGDGKGLERRIAEHLAGRGSKLTQAAVAAGIEIELVACWRAPLAFEKYLKRRKDAPRLCPVCCKARGRKARQIVVAEQLTLPFDLVEAETIEPWPEGFEFEAPQLLRPAWAEIDYERRARAAGVALIGGDDWDDGLI